MHRNATRHEERGLGDFRRLIISLRLRLLHNGACGSHFDAHKTGSIQAVSNMITTTTKAILQIRLRVLMSYPGASVVPNNEIEKASIISS